MSLDASDKDPVDKSGVSSSMNVKAGLSSLYCIDKSVLNAFVSNEGS